MEADSCRSSSGRADTSVLLLPGVRAEDIVPHERHRLQLMVTAAALLATNSCSSSAEQQFATKANFKPIVCDVFVKKRSLRVVGRESSGWRRNLESEF